LRPAFITSKKTIINTKNSIMQRNSNTAEATQKRTHFERWEVRFNWTRTGGDSLGEGRRVLESVERLKCEQKVVKITQQEADTLNTGVFDADNHLNKLVLHLLPGQEEVNGIRIKNPWD
jgi:hypothetical protein